MRMMEFSSPIDLRISKPNEFYPETTLNSWNSQCLENLQRQQKPSLYQSHKPMQIFSYIPRIPPNYKNINLSNPMVNDGLNIIPKSSESGIITPSVSPDSSFRGCDGCEQASCQNDKMRQLEMGGIKRRLSDGSISSNDSNNNGRRKVAESIEIKTTSDSSPKKKKKITDIPGTLSPDFGSRCNDVVDEKSFKREPGSPEPSRVVLSPASFSSSEPENCDSSTRLRTTRPFKAITSNMIIDPIPSNGPLGDFEAFRLNILSRVNSSNKSTNQNMRRTGNTANTHITDPTYWEKRKRNNEAAKRSRDARRRKEDEVAIRCAYLEQERILMLQENKLLKEALKKYQDFYMH